MDCGYLAQLESTREHILAYLIFGYWFCRRGVIMHFHKSIGSGAPTPVPARSFLYKLCGASQPAIIQGSDGAFYVVKFNGFPGTHSLLSEVIGSELIVSLGLPAPKWVPIEISSRFISENQDLWFRSANAPVPPLPGLHFGSRLIEAEDDSRTYQMIPHSWIDRIENRADFLGMLIVDLWANNCDRRQTVFLAAPEGSLQASFIDNGLMFGGKSRNDTTCPRRVMIYDVDVYKGLWGDNMDDIVKEWLRRIDHIGEEAIRRIISYVPDSWVQRGLDRHVIDQLRERRSSLPCLLNEAKETLNSTYSVQYHKTRNATEPGQIFSPPVLPALP